MPFVTKVKESVTAQGPKAMNVTLDFDEKALYEEVCLSANIVSNWRSVCLSLFIILIALDGVCINYIRFNCTLCTDDLVHGLHFGVGGCVCGIF